MSSPNGEEPYILYDLMRVADFRFLLKPLHVGKCRRVHFNNMVEVFDVISRAEIIEHNLKPILWWNTIDYESAIYLDDYFNRRSDKFYSNVESVQETFYFIIFEF